MPSKARRNISGQMGAKDCCNRRLEAATISEILHLSGQGNLPFIREKSGESQGILKTDVCGNHVLGSLNSHNIYWLCCQDNCVVPEKIHTHLM